MGEMADYEIERMIWQEPRNSAGGRLRKSTFQSGIGNYKWRRAGGEVIDMHDMEDEYIANCIRMCEEMGNPGKKEQLEAVLKARQSVYLDQARNAPSSSSSSSEAERRIGKSTTWEVPKWVYEK